MRGKRISRQKLNNAIKELPIPVQEHCKRCKLLSSFLVEKIKDEDWFLDEKYNPESIISAVYLHDIGKCKIPKDNIYAEHNTTASKKKIYRSHVEEGISFVERLSEFKFSELGERAFETYVYCAISEHHEYVDGSGFPAGKKGDEISLTGKITAIADTFDNLLFVGNSDTPDIDGAIEELLKLSGTVLDKKLVKKLTSSKKTLKEFIEYINTSDKNKRKTDNYGLQFMFDPIMNIRENTVLAYYTEFVLNDPYYGIVRPDVFLPVSEKTGQITKLQKIAFERLCIQIDKMKEKGIQIPTFTLHLSSSCFEKKTFIKDIEKTADKWGVNKGKICFILNESEIPEFDETILRAIEDLRHMGFRVAINILSENTTFLTMLDSISIDFLYIDKKYTRKITDNEKTFGILSGVAIIANSLTIPMVFSGVDEKQAEILILKTKANYAHGERYGEQMTEKALLSHLNGGGKK